MKKIDLVSDIHLEFYPGSEEETLFNFLPEKPESELLIMAGDIHTNQTFEHYADLARTRYEKVIAIPGNHDYWHSTATPEIFDEPRQVIEMDDHVFITAVGWAYHQYTKPDRSIRYIMSLIEYDRTRVHYDHERFSVPFNYHEFTNQGKLDYDFIFDSVGDFKYSDKKIIVVTHYPPSLMSVSERFKDSKDNDLFCSDFDADIYYDSRIALWVHGHTHDATDYMINKTRVVSHPCGYPMERVRFDMGDYRPLQIEV